MKPIKKGKRFSRIQTTTVNTKDDTPEEVIKLLERISNRHPSELITFDNIILRYSKTAISILKKNNLPDSPILYWPNHDDEWSSQRPTNQCKASYLDNYIIEQLGKEHDSPEGLSAKILTKIDLLEKAQDKNKLLLAVELGELYTLLNIYNIESTGNTKNAKACKKKKWAEKLAEYLVKNSPQLSFEEYWKSIPDNDHEEPILGCYRHENNNSLCFDNAEKHEQLIKGTFRTSYITPAKKKIIPS